MACIGCGSDTKAGVVMCGRCLERINDPLSFLERFSDPMADLRLQRLGNALLRVFPASSPRINFGEEIEPAVRIGSLLESGAQEHLCFLVEQYLASAGISFHLWGDERIPRRAFLWRLVQEVGNLEFNSEIWARASVRMGNIHSLLVLSVSDMQLEESWRLRFVKQRVANAISAYSRAKEYPALWKVARSNIALLWAWIGKTEEALQMLGELCSGEVDEESAPFSLKRAMVLCDAGRAEECREELSRIPGNLADSRLIKFRTQLEANE
ncbi:MAG: hypothetical protein QW520_01470 [Methanomassiliicoccales archaeon]